MIIIQENRLGGKLIGQRSMGKWYTYIIAFTAMVVTSSFFSDDAINLADKRGSLMSLADFNKLMEWIRNYR